MRYRGPRAAGPRGATSKGLAYVGGPNTTPVSVARFTRGSSRSANSLQGNATPQSRLELRWMGGTRPCPLIVALLWVGTSNPGPLARAGAARATQNPRAITATNALRIFASR